MVIKLAERENLEAIIKIYNEFIGTSITMDTEKATLESKDVWFKDHNQNHPIICYIENEEIRGWASLSPWSSKKGYSKSVELSVYVAKSSHNQGIGKSLMKEAIKLAGLQNYHCIISRIDSSNELSLYLHKKLGFTYIGTMKEIGFKFGKYIDIIILQLLL